MATPNDSGPVKKPTPSVPPAKAPVPKPAAPGAKPTAGSTPPAKPPAPQPGAKPAAKPTNVRPGAAPVKPTNGAPAAKPKPAAGGPPAKKPVAKKERTDGSTRGGKRKLGQVLIDLGFIDEDQLWAVLEEAKSTGVPTGTAAVAQGLVNEEQLLQALAEQNGLKVANLQEVKPQTEVLALVPETMADVYKILPLSLNNKVLTIVIGDPANMSAVDDLRNLLSLNEVIALLGTPAAIAEAKAKFYAGKEESIMDVIQELEANPELGGRQKETSIDLASLAEIADAAPVRKLINMVFLLAIKDKASDIHFEPFEDEYKMRYRCDGTLYEMVPPPRHLAMAISSRIKVMSNLDIAERRLPQDGRIELNVGGNPVDMRVSILPTLFGESVVIRVLDRTNTSLDLNKIGMEPEMLAQFREIIGKPNGIILVTGPTGAGKTTTLYSALNELNVVSEKLITTEDPIEYDIDGLVQVPINSEIGVTFASALRHPPAGPGQDPGWRDSRSGNRANRGAGVADRPRRLQHAAHQRLAEFDLAFARHGPGAVFDHGHAGGRVGAAAGAQDLRRLPHRVRAVGRDADGVEPAAGGRQGQDVLLRPRLRPLQQQRTQGPAGHLRTAHHERRPARHDLVRRLDGRTARGVPAARDADVARVGFARPVQRRHHHRGGGARDGVGRRELSGEVVSSAASGGVDPRRRDRRDKPGGSPHTEHSERSEPCRHSSTRRWTPAAGR